jgi:riboflavin biosynthesis pyrimidine reductase
VLPVVRSLLPGPTGEPALERHRLEQHYALPPAPARHVRANFVTTLDGAIEIDGRSGSLGGDGDTAVFHLLRELTDVVLVGAGTARAEGYGAAVMPDARQGRRLAAGQLPVPPIAVVTGRGIEADLPLLTPVSGAPQPLVLTTAAAAARAPDVVRRRAELVVCGEETVDLARLLDELAARGLYRVLCEGGPALFSDLTRADLVDELCLTLSPTLAGPDHKRLIVGQRWNAAQRLTLAGGLEDNGDLLLRYSRYSR